MVRPFPSEIECPDASLPFSFQILLATDDFLWRDDILLIFFFMSWRRHAHAIFSVRRPRRRAMLLHFRRDLPFLLETPATKETLPRLLPVRLRYFHFQLPFEYHQAACCQPQAGGRPEMLAGVRCQAMPAATATPSAMPACLLSNGCSERMPAGGRKAPLAFMMALSQQNARRRQACRRCLLLLRGCGITPGPACLSPPAMPLPSHAACLTQAATMPLGEGRFLAASQLAHATVTHTQAATLMPFTTACQEGLSLRDSLSSPSPIIACFLCVRGECEACEN